MIYPNENYIIVIPRRVELSKEEKAAGLPTLVIDKYPVVTVEKIPLSMGNQELWKIRYEDGSPGTIWANQLIPYTKE